MELEHQVIGSEARDVPGPVPAFQGIIKLIGQEDRFQLGGGPNVFIPGCAILAVIGLSEQGIYGVEIKRPLVAQEGLGNFRKPLILDRVIEPVQMFHNIPDPLGPSDRGKNLAGRHAGRVGQLCIVVVAQNFVEVPGRRSVWVNMRVRVENRPAQHFLVQIAGK